MKTKSHKIPIVILFLLFIYGCEYERISAPENECNPETINLTIESVQSTSCGESSGEIVAIVNGDAQYLYRLNNGEFGDKNAFTELSAGSYTVQAKVVNTNCLSEEVEVRVENEDGLQIALIEKSNSTCGENTGSITVAQEGGVEPIEYIINSSAVQGSPEFTALSNGNYTIVARDANGCEAEISGIEISTGISFSNEIKSIITTNCAVTGCHNGSQPPNFSEDGNIFQNAARIKSRTGSGNMPPAGRPDLTDTEIQKIACWVDDGALDN